jgi:hypothetical protein
MARFANTRRLAVTGADRLPPASMAIAVTA